MKILRKALIDIADRESLPVECLITKKELEMILRSSEVNKLQWPSRIERGWRGEIVKPEILKLISGLGSS